MRRDKTEPGEPDPHEKTQRNEKIKQIKRVTSTSWPSGRGKEKYQIWQEMQNGKI